MWLSMMILFWLMMVFIKVKAMSVWISREKQLQLDLLMEVLPPLLIVRIFIIVVFYFIMEKHNLLYYADLQSRRVKPKAAEEFIARMLLQLFLSV